MGGNGQNITYFDSSIDNYGNFRPTEYVDAETVVNEGATVGWISAGEWMEYTVDVQTTGCYDLSMRYASGNTNGGGPFYFEVDGVKASPDIVVSHTGGWAIWNNKLSSIELSAGIHVLRLVVDNGEFNLGEMTFTYNPEGCAPVGDIGLPFDFESAPVSSSFSNFNGGMCTVEPVTAPQNVDNCSANLAKLVRDGGDVWAGAYLDLQGGLDFNNENYITLRLWTNAPINTTVRMKLDAQNNAGNFAELDVLTQTTGEWETLSWNFSTSGATVFDRLVFMFDFGNTGNGSATSTFYFDDVQQVAILGEPLPSENCQPICPTDFNENGITDGEDFAIYLGNFGLTCNGCPTDLNADNVNDGLDFAIFLGNFGLSCE